jgi:hypothetical protein
MIEKGTEGYYPPSFCLWKTGKIVTSCVRASFIISLFFRTGEKERERVKSFFL